ncbi:unnamed protein product, partial [Ectocarpus sp. 4 AP-2014]
DPSFRVLVGRFVSGLPERLGELQAAAQESRLEEVQRLAHQLKGAGGGYGFEQMTAPAHALERLAECGAPSAEIASALKGLGNVCDAIEADWIDY